MRIAIIGIGAMGCLFGGKLAPLADVIMVGSWPEQLVALETSGIKLHEINGRITQIPVQVTSKTHEINPVDLVLVMVKSGQTKRAARQSDQILAPNGLALTLQNGLGNLEQLSIVLGPHRTALGITAQGATIIQPGHVRHAGHGPTHLAYTPETIGILTKVTTLFREANLETYLADDAESLVWGKLVINVGINPLTALLRKPNGFLVENEVAFRVMKLAVEETSVVARHQGIQLPYENAVQRAVEVAQGTAANYSSMLQDILRRAPTEIEAICGAVVKRGRLLNIPTPINQELLALIKKMEGGDPMPQIADNSPIAELIPLIRDSGLGVET